MPDVQFNDVFCYFRNSSSNVRALNERPVSPASTLDRASLNSALTLSSHSGLPVCICYRKYINSIKP